MAIDRIPGVGPTNADIATAVAAPSAATIAATVAAPSAATIAAAVAAPSSATIASAVAAAVPTTAGITSIVQANAGGAYSGTMTNLGFLTMGGVNSVNFTGLSGYKYLQFFIVGVSPAVSNSDFSVRMNNDTSNSYSWLLPVSNNTTNNIESYTSSQTTFGLIAGSIPFDLTSLFAYGKISNSNSAVSYKLLKFNGRWSPASAPTQKFVQNGIVMWKNNAAISSMTFYFNQGQVGTVDTPTGIFMFGGN